MEEIEARGKFHAAHRQLGYDGKCAFVHGHTWRGTFTIKAESFPRDPQLDMGVDFGVLKGIFKSLDHKMLISEKDRMFLDAELFEPEGVVVLAGDNPSVENVAAHCSREAERVLVDLFPGKQIEYQITTTIQETDNNFFTNIRAVTI